MSDESKDDEAPEPVPAPPAPPAPPTYGPPAAATAVPAAPRKKLSERTFGWKSVAPAAAVGLVIGGGVAAGVVAAVVDGGPDQGRRELGQRGGGQMPYGQMPDGRTPDRGQMPDLGRDGGGPPDGFGQRQDQSDGQSSPGQAS